MNYFSLISILILCVRLSILGYSIRILVLWSIFYSFRIFQRCFLDLDWQIFVNIFSKHSLNTTFYFLLSIFRTETNWFQIVLRVKRLWEIDLLLSFNYCLNNWSKIGLSVSPFMEISWLQRWQFLLIL